MKIPNWNGLKQYWLHLAIGIFLLNVLLKLPFAGNSSLFLDEAVAIFETQGSLSSTIAFSASDPTPPLYYLVLGLWCKLFGISELSARFPSMLFSSLSAAFIFILGNRHLSLRAGLFAAGLFSLSNLAMVFAHEARSYALASLLMVISYLLFLDIFHERSMGWKTILALALVNLLLLHTHYLSSMGLATQGLLSLGILLRNRPLFLKYALSQVLAVCLWLPWLFYNRSLLQDSKVTAWLKPPDWAAVHYAALNFAGSKHLLWLCIALLLAGTAGLLIWKSRNTEPPKPSTVLVLAAWLLLSIALQFVVSLLFLPAFELRYILYALPGGCLLIAGMISALPFHRTAQWLVFGLFAGLSLRVFDINPQKPENWRAAVQYVKEIANEKSSIFVMAEYQYPSFAYYYNQEIFKAQAQIKRQLQAKKVILGQSPEILPSIDSIETNNIILVQSHEKIVDPENKVFQHLSERYCIQRRSAFPGIKVSLFQNPPCTKVSGGHFVRHFDLDSMPDAAETLTILKEEGNKSVTFVGKGHEFSAVNTWKVSELQGGNFSTAELKVKGKYLEAGKQISLVFLLEHEGESYNWLSFELQQSYEPGKWFEATYQAIVPEIKSPEDVVKIYIWSPQGAEGYFERLEVDFWEG